MIWADFKTSSRLEDLLSEASFMTSSTDPLAKSSILFLASQGSVMLHNISIDWHMDVDWNCLPLGNP